MLWVWGGGGGGGFGRGGGIWGVEHFSCKTAGIGGLVSGFQRGESDFLREG